MNTRSHDRAVITATRPPIRPVEAQPVRHVPPQEWCIRKAKLIALVVALVAASASWAQVLSPAEIKDPDLRSLQQQYLSDLKAVGQDVLALQLEYHFYLSRKLDLD